jgi:hypothetical protein
MKLDSHTFVVVQESSFSIAEERLIAIHDDPHQPWSFRSRPVMDEFPVQETISDGC